MFNEIGLRFNFVTNTSSYEEGDFYFYDRSPACRGLYFVENPDQEEDTSNNINAYLTLKSKVYSFFTTIK
jgi:hypothetical protein